MKKVIVVNYSFWHARLPLGTVWIVTSEQAARDVIDLVQRLEPAYQREGFNLETYPVDLVTHKGNEWHIGMPKREEAEAVFNCIPGDIRAMEEYRVLLDFAQKVRVALVPVEELKPL